MVGMKIQFDEQEYQLQAIQAITEIFQGQPMRGSSLICPRGEMVGREVTEMAISNKLEISDAEVLTNLQKIQERNRLKKSTHLHNWNFTIEMETGTGKTYVYIRTIFELHKRYGFSKFIIVVPSVAIREGVYKSFQMTAAHLAEKYPGQLCHYFKYDSTKLEQVREFAMSSQMEVMIINIDAFRKSFEDPTKASKANLIHREQDKLCGQKPIQLIQATRPIVIIDEPQSVDHTVKAKEAIASLHPLCKLRYSATHRETYNLLYKLDPVTAYQRRLVKKIEVLSIQAEPDHNQPYLKLLKVSHQNGYKAMVEMDVLGKNGLARVKKEIDIHRKKDLYPLSGKRDLYRGYVVEGIDCYPGKESVQFANGQILRLGEAIGVDEDWIKRQQIHATIQTHLDKECRLVPKGIKVLTLFFIDRVENYRVYPKGSSWKKGKYAKMFEEEYNKLIRLSKYQALLQMAPALQKPAEEVHGGYFARDQQGRFKNSRMTKDGRLRATKDDESTFALIMKEKEKLLSLQTPLRFIFSHSALREGWDNPNVFQICTLVETKDPMTKRQKIGRGLRLAVDQEGRRQYDEETNVLTIIANESYQAFAELLQKEIAQETGIKWEKMEQIVTEAKLTRETQSAKEKQRNDVALFTKKWEAIWQEIHTKTIYAVEWDPRELKQCCIMAIQQLKQFFPRKVRKETAWVQMDHSGLSSQLQTIEQLAATETNKLLPNLLRHLQEQTHLKKQTIVEILLASQRLDQFVANPRAFIEAVATAINQEKRRLIRNGVQYERIDEGRCYRQSLFDYQALIAELRSWGMDGVDQDALLSFLSDHFKEKQNFGEKQGELIQFYDQLPSSFKIDTPLGSYQPTWALHIQREDREKWYLGMGTIAEPSF